MTATILLRTVFLLSLSSFSLLHPPVRLSRPFAPTLISSAALSLELLSNAPITANAYAFPQMEHEESTPCPDDTEPAATVQAHPSPTTVTVTVFFPTSSTAALHPSTSDYLNATTPYVSDATSNSTSTPTTPSSTSTASTNALVSIAEEAQQLNAQFRSLTAGDACIPGQRACINSQLAQCTSPDNGSAPRWVTLPCPIDTTTNEQPTCVALPPSSLPPTATSSTNSSSSTPNQAATVELGCFITSTISQRFSNAGVQGGMFPPGFSQTSNASKENKVGEKLPIGALLLLLVVIMLG